MIKPFPATPKVTGKAAKKLRESLASVASETEMDRRRSQMRAFAEAVKPKSARQSERSARTAGTRGGR